MKAVAVDMPATGIGNPFLSDRLDDMALSTPAEAHYAFVPEDYMDVGQRGRYLAMAEEWLRSSFQKIRPKIGEMAGKKL